MKNTYFIYVIDNDPHVRDAVWNILDRSGCRVRVYPSATAFLDEAPEPRGCVLTNIRMPDIDGLELQRLLAERSSPIPMIMMAGPGDIGMAVRAMKAGAIDCLEKPFETAALLAAVDRALAQCARQSEADASAAEVAARLAALTPREREVLDHLVRSLSTKAIAAELGISPRTVEVHRARIKDKLQADGIADLTRLVLGAEWPRHDVVWPDLVRAPAPPRDRQRPSRSDRSVFPGTR